MSLSVDLAYSAIAKLYPLQIHEAHSKIYKEACSSFWNARQQEARPRCIFQPTTAQQVSDAIVEVVQSNAPFAIKGGGHSSNARGSTIDNGFLFDLVKLDHIEVSADRKTVKLGPGLRWSAVFEHLQREKLTAVGGRDSTVGVPGFIFGGGLSNYGTQRGWGIDNLVAVDIVLANGKMISADADHHGDLFTALLGGGAHNFGIVTSLTVQVYPYNGLWGGCIRYAPEHIDEVFTAYNSYTQELTLEGKAHTILDFQVFEGKTHVAQWMAYPDPVANPHIFDHFRRISHENSTLRLAEATELAAEVHNLTFSTGLRNTYWVYTYEFDMELLRDLVAVFNKNVVKAPTRFKITLEFNHITPEHRLKAAREGRRNVFGLEASSEMLIIVLLNAVWDNKEDDNLVESILQSMGQEFDAMAKSRDKYNNYLYMNYANHRQAVIPSYGGENQAFLKKVAAQYDPTGVFQRLNLAGFKIDPEGETI